MYKLICCVGLHVPRKSIAFSFADIVSGKAVYRGRCDCGRCWLTDEPGRLFGFKVAVELEGKPHHRSSEQ